MRFLPALLAFTLAAATGHAALPRLAYFGTLKGSLNIPALPPLAWTVESTAPADRQQTARFTLTGEGVALRATITADEPSGTVSWRIDEGRVQLASWAGALARRFAPSAPSITATGEMIITGEGILVGFQPTGRIALHCENVTARDDTAGWILDGIAFAGKFSLGPDRSLESASPFDVSIKTITTTRLGARAFSLRGRLQNLSAVAIENARIEIAGGEVTASPFTAPLAPLSIETRVQIKRIGLQDFAQLMPSGLADARGRLDGDLGLSWAPASGFHLGIGTLSLDEFEPTVLRLAPSPGLLTSSLSARIQFLPGRLGRWLSIRNNVYDDLRAIELGKADLRVNSLRVFLTPDGDDQGRSARVLMDAGPVKQDGAVKQVIFAINVNGPLSRLLNLRMTDNVSFETR